MTTLSEPETRSVTTTQADRRLRLFRALWLATFAVILLLFLVGVLVYFRQMMGARHQLPTRRPNPAMPRHRWRKRRLPARAYAFYKLFAGVLGSFPFT